MKYKKYFDHVNIELVALTQPLKINPDTGKLLTPQEFIAYTARVSNPSNQMNTMTADKLLNYCIEKKHWSIFQMVSMCFEINTTRDIGRQMLRHHFDWQEFCVEENTKIHTIENGKLKLIPIKNLYKIQNTKDHFVKIYNEDTKLFDVAKIKEVFDTKIKPVYKLTLDNGRNITTTAFHKLFTLNGFKNVRDLDIDNDFIAINGIPSYQDKNWMEQAKSEVKLKNTTPRYIKIKSIEYIGERQTYDIEVDHINHNYIANGIVTHNSQRYADPTKDMDFVIREARLQDTKNRQNSIEIADDSHTSLEWYNMQVEIIDEATKKYKKAIEMGVAKENARSILPEGNTCTRMYMSGHLRSFIHYCEVREDMSTQKEHRIIAEKIKAKLREHFSFLA